MRRFYRLLALFLAAPIVAAPAHGQASPPTSKVNRSIVAMAVRASLFHVQPTTEQQTKIKAIVEQQRSKLVAIHESMKPWPAKLKTAREQHDTAAMRAARVELRHGRVAIVQVARQSLIGVRPILTTAQQTQFDTNVQRVRPALMRFARFGRRPG